MSKKTTPDSIDRSAVIAAAEALGVAPLDWTSITITGDEVVLALTLPIVDGGDAR